MKEFRPKYTKVNEMLNLPPPDNEYGYTSKLLNTLFLSEEEKETFHKWMYGQTMACTEEGMAVIYTEDVERGLRLIRYNMPTYFD